MDQLFAHLTLADIRLDVIRNIVSIGTSQNLFDDLADSQEDWALAQHVEDEVKPRFYQSGTPIIARPFEDANWFNAIAWPFRNWQASRYADGTFGVWYGCDTVETSVWETAYHWLNGILRDAGFEHENVVIERKLYNVSCHAALLDFRPLIGRHPDLVNRTDYGTCQQVGARLHREGHPGWVTQSVRFPAGSNFVVLNEKVLSNPRLHCQLTYRLEGQTIVVEKQLGAVWMEIATDLF
jgi:RES domain